MEKNKPKVKVSDEVINMLNAPIMPDIPEINSLTGGDGSWLMIELEYKFSKYPDGFFMFYEPKPEHPTYEKGQSWKEKLYLPVSTIKKDFDNIGVRYNSLKEYESVADKFNNKYYCSIYESKGKRAFYLRNNALVDKDIQSILGDSTVAGIYDFCLRVREIRGKQIIKDIEDGKYVEKVSCRGKMISVLPNPDEFPEEVIQK